MFEANKWDTGVFYPSYMNMSNVKHIHAKNWKEKNPQRTIPRASGGLKT